MSAAPDRQAIGAAAETAARSALESVGLRTLARNVSYRFGELDLVMGDGDAVVFVEVRYRRDDRFGGGAASVDVRKRRRIVLAARAWLAGRRGSDDVPCRFDVVTVQGQEGDLRTDWLRAAFSLDDV